MNIWKQYEPTRINLNFRVRDRIGGPAHQMPPVPGVR